MTGSKSQKFNIAMISDEQEFMPKIAYILEKFKLQEIDINF